MGKRTSKRALQSAAKENPLVNLLGMLNPYRNSHPPSQLLEWTLDECLAALKNQHAKGAPEDVRETIVQAASALSDVVINGELGRDYLGELYMLMRSSWKGSAMGQFFTPTEVCRLMAKINAPSTLPMPNGELCRVHEPASGSGAMLLALLQEVVESQGPHALRYLSLTAVDLDPLCAKMTAVQLLYFAIRVVSPIGEIAVFQGNALGPPAQWRQIIWAEHDPDGSKVKMTRTDERRDAAG